MTERERLVELIEKATWETAEKFKEQRIALLRDGKKPEITQSMHEQIADHLLANGVIVPPCKVGDKVYWLDDGKIKHCEVFEISIHSDGILVHTGIQFCLKPDAVFLTKEAAEHALAERNVKDA